MFTGIIESLGILKSLEKEGTNVHFTFQSSISPELKVDQSLSHNGVCLTVTGIEGNVHKVTAVAETMEKSNLGQLKVGAQVNLERCMIANGRFDGHIVQGHVDECATCIGVDDQQGSTIFTFKLLKKSLLFVEKGSITINGISLTIFNCTEDQFSVTIIPYTMEQTIMGSLKKNDTVNIEFDIVGKYVARMTKG
ncbi:MAG: riboflavin synthase [Sphingobacteriales bacterium]|jgi:riboflavin synthase